MENNDVGCSEKNDDAAFLGFEINTTPGRHDKFIVPDYDIKRKYKLVGDSVKECNDNSQAAKRRRLGNSCWNCGESGHSNRECSQPFNPGMLARNRQQFMNSRPVRNGAQRYHTDNEQRFSHLRPGVISKKLQKAMGLQKQQLPRYIYNMRRLGYPGGWLEEAKVVHSGITLFDSKGNVVADPDDEEGEVVDDAEQRNKYDVNKLIEYPGFNVPPPLNFIDESEKYRVPPMREDQSLQYLVNSLRPNAAKAYRRLKIPILPSASPPRITENSQDVSTNDDDMECEETPEIGLLPEDGCGFVPPLPEEPLPPPPPETVPEPLTEDGECSSQSTGESSSRISPTLVELEEQKKSILVELNCADSSDSMKELASPAVTRVLQQSISSSRTPSPSLGRMKSVDLGTTILKSVSPFSKLPSSKSFSQNICDVINFENLPDSTGIYDKMVGILSKVRSAVKRSQYDAAE